MRLKGDTHPEFTKTWTHQDSVLYALTSLRIHALDAHQTGLNSSSLPLLGHPVPMVSYEILRMGHTRKSRSNPIPTVHNALLDLLHLLGFLGWETWNLTQKTCVGNLRREA